MEDEVKIPWPQGAKPLTGQQIRPETPIMTADLDNQDDLAYVTFEQLSESVKEIIEITGQEIAPLVGGNTSGTALSVPAGPTGQVRTADVVSGKWYNFGSGAVQATANKRWRAFWNGTTWTLVDMGPLPQSEVANEFGESTTVAISQAKVTEVKNNVDVISVEVPSIKQAVNRKWVDVLSLDYNSLTDRQKQIFTFLKDIRIVGFSESPEEIGIYSFILNHSTFKYRIGLRMKKGEGYVDTGVIEFPNFDNPINLTIDGVSLTVKIDVEHLDKLGPDADRVIISTSGAPFINLSPDCFVDNLQDFNAIEEDIDIINNTVSSINSELTSINSELMGLTEVNILKNPRANYSNAEKLIISSIKNIEFYNVPNSIAKDDIFVRAFSADAEVGSGRYGRQIYLANRRIYQETSNWNNASILITGLIPCDFQEHSFDVTVATGAMSGLRIRMTVDYSVFTDVAPFNYSTNVNNRVTFNLQKTGNAVLDDKVSALEEEVADLDTVDSYTMPMRQRNIAFLGSSNVWGDGFLFYSYIKAPIEWLFKSSGKFNGALDVTASGSTTVNNAKKFLGDTAVKITGVGSEIKFKHRGSELNICQVIERTSNFAVVGIYDGSTKIAEFTNHNDTVGSGSKNFTGNGTQTKFELDRCFTYNHSLTVNGQSKNIILNTQGTSASIPAEADCMVIRSLDVNGKVIHSLWFKVAPANGDNIVVNYQYGETICFVKSTVGETSDGTNESPYGDGTISYDPTNPSAISTGLDFRLINEKSFIKYWFDTDEERDITLKIERGTNPYFTFNFSSSVYHNVMNAGIGGWTAAMFNSGNFLNRAYWNIADHFSPDMVTIGLTGNDDWSNFPRKINRVVNMTLAELREYPSLEIGAIEYQSGNDTYNVTINTDIITEISSTSLKASSIIGSSVAVGDFARIGTYTGDLRQVQTRRIETVDLVSGEITWIEPLHLNEYICLDSLQDLVGQDVSIRSIDEYMAQMNTLIENILRMVPKCKICLFNVYYVDMWNRNVAEYTYIQQWVADKFKDNVFVLDAWKYARDYVESSRKSRVINATANGTNELPFTSPSYNGHWEGVEVWVNDRNVYGKDCYVQTGWLYTVDPAKTGADLNWTGSNAYLRPFSKTTQMKLIWKDNAPSNGTSVQIRLAFRQWSNDYAHPNDGDYISNSLGRAMIYALK